MNTETAKHSPRGAGWKPAPQGDERCRGLNRVALAVEPPGRVLLVPWGNVKSSGRGGDHLVDEEAGRLVLEAFRGAGVDIVIDREHASELEPAAMPAGMAPAMGWIKGIEVVPGEGLFGVNVEWTDEGAELVRTKKYRYLSWAGMLRKKDGRLARITSVALTNRPGIGMPPIVNREEPAAPEGDGERVKEKNKMDKIVKALGMADGADETACASAIQKIKADAAALKTSHAAACKAAKVAETATGDELVAAVNKLAAPPAAGDVVSRAEYEAVANSAKANAAELAELKKAQADREAEERMSSARSEGRLSEADLTTGAHASYYRELAHNKAAWDVFMEHLPAKPKCPPDGRVATTNKAAGGGAGSDRAAVIGKAAAEFEAHRGASGMFASKADWITGDLVAGGHKALSKEEAEKFAA